MPRPEDPVVKGARREALVVFGIFLTAMIYTVGYCYLYGYDVPPEKLTFVWGVPAWVFWGILLPWLICLGLSFWFGRFFMTTPDLGTSIDEEAEDDDA